MTGRGLADCARGRQGVGLPATRSDFDDDEVRARYLAAESARARTLYHALLGRREWAEGRAVQYAGGPAPSRPGVVLSIPCA
eukprot:7381189-Prymnesium_polylepis.1